MYSARGQILREQLSIGEEVNQTEMVKASVRGLYFVLRAVFLPFVWILGTVGVKAPRVVSTFTLSLCFILSEPVAAGFGAPAVIAMFVAGGLLAFLFLIWGNEFEEL